VEFGDPDLLQEVLDFLCLEVLHHIRDKLNIFLDGVPVVPSLHDSDACVQELSEIATNGQVDEHLLVKSSIVVAFNSSNILEFGEVA